MDRRGFLKGFAMGAAGLMVPSATTYFLPPKGGWPDTSRVRMTQRFLDPLWGWGVVEEQVIEPGVPTGFAPVKEEGRAYLYDPEGYAVAQLSEDATRRWKTYTWQADGSVLIRTHRPLRAAIDDGDVSLVDKTFAPSG